MVGRSLKRCARGVGGGTVVGSGAEFVVCFSSTGFDVNGESVCVATASDFVSVVLAGTFSMVDASIGLLGTFVS